MPSQRLAPLLFALLLCASLPHQSAPAQSSRSGLSSEELPPSWTQRTAPLPAVGVLDVPVVDLVVVAKEDRRREEEGLPPRYAVVHRVSLTPETHGTWEELPGRRAGRGAGFLWRLRVRGPGAVSLNLGFRSFRLPEGARLHLYAADRTARVRAFSEMDNEAHRELWTPPVPGEELLLELFLPARPGALEELELELTDVGYGYRGFGVPAPSLQRSGSCNVDVVCPEGDDWQLEIPSVAVISLGGGTFCSGFLVNNTAQDLTPYFMTANHCGIHSGNAASLVAFWNYENSFCRPPGSGQSGGPGDGTLNEFNTGSFFRASYSPSDFTLVELDDDPDPAFEVSWSGWDRSGSDATSAVAIHHPATDEKRISFEDDPTTTTSYLDNAVPGDGTHVRVTDWDLGTTEGGSSGSPLYDQNHRVIGQLHGGFASCSSQTSDWYGKFSVSWTGGGTALSRLSDHLDSGGTGAMTTDSVSLETLCSEDGTVAFGRSAFACEDAALVRVVDCDLNADPGLAETVSVTVDSTSEPGGESLLLTETGLNTSRFEGTIPISGTDGPGTLLVASGDTMTALYVDADDGMGGMNMPKLAAASVDCTVPSILSVQTKEVRPTSAKVLVTADEPVRATVRYGASCGSLTQSESTPSYQSSSTVELAGLSPEATYHYEVEIADEAGNVVTDDAGGACYVFTTPAVPDLFTEQFANDNDVDAFSFRFTPRVGLTGYEICQNRISGLPTDPAGGTPIPLGDDDSSLVVLSPSNLVHLYGNAHDRFFVGSNGYITFGQGDSDYTESLAEHFQIARVSGLFDDLNPAAAGLVSYRELSDRVAVTWENVPEFNAGTTNTFQIELFFDGQIRLSYLAIAAQDGLVGLSAGTGLPPGFAETDFGTMRRCPRGWPYLPTR